MQFTKSKRFSYTNQIRITQLALSVSTWNINQLVKIYNRVSSLNLNFENINEYSDRHHLQGCMKVLNLVQQITCSELKFKMSLKLIGQSKSKHGMKLWNFKIGNNIWPTIKSEVRSRLAKIWNRIVNVLVSVIFQLGVSRTTLHKETYSTRILHNRNLHTTNKKCKGTPSWFPGTKVNFRVYATNPGGRSHPSRSLTA